MTQTLLLVLPGMKKREDMLRRMMAVDQSVQWVAFVPREVHADSSWASKYFPPTHWISCEHPTDAFEAAWEVVKAWLKAGCGSRVLNGVICYDEFGIALAASLAERLGVKATPLNIIKRARNKHLFRRRCSTAGLPAVRCLTLRTTEDVRQSVSAREGCFPAVLKPQFGAGSWCTRRVNSETELLELWPTLMEVSGGVLRCIGGRGRELVHVSVRARH